jgi:hypothetical protein
MLGSDVMLVQGELHPYRLRQHRVPKSRLDRLLEQACLMLMWLLMAKASPDWCTYRIKEEIRPSDPLCQSVLQPFQANALISCMLVQRKQCVPTLDDDDAVRHLHVLTLDFLETFGNALEWSLSCQYVGGPGNYYCDTCA